MIEAKASVGFKFEEWLGILKISLTIMKAPRNSCVNRSTNFFITQIIFP